MDTLTVKTEVDELLDMRSPAGVLQPIVKWAGGKEKELKYIVPNIPRRINNYYEPFVGGGSVYVSIAANNYFINDKSTELISLYECIASKNQDFFNYAKQIDASWSNADKFFYENPSLRDMYYAYRRDDIDGSKLKTKIVEFSKTAEQEIQSILCGDIKTCVEVLIQEMRTNLFRKMTRMKELEQIKHALPENDIADNIKTAIKSALYMYYRYLYNKCKSSEENKALRTALFLFIRNYCYSGMFRYNDKGEFNVPYGGIAYNAKQMSKKLRYYQSAALSNLLKKTSIENTDFESALQKWLPSEEDFVFLDPPYDSEFSTYAQNEFTRADHERLARYMTSECKAKWMLIIKNTDFIFNLYNKPGIRIRTFDKEYLVSFMNRNDRHAVHLLITNY